MSINELPMISLFHIGNAIQTLNKRFEKNFGLSLVQWCLLKVLIDMPSSPAHSLADAVGVHPSTLTQTLKRLERKKFIFITEDPRDSRKKLISITRSGKEALDQVGQKMSKWTSELLEINSNLFKIRDHLQNQLKVKEL